MHFQNKMLKIEFTLHIPAFYLWLAIHHQWSLLPRIHEHEAILFDLTPIVYLEYIWTLLEPCLSKKKLKKTGISCFVETRFVLFKNSDFALLAIPYRKLYYLYFWRNFSYSIISTSLQILTFTANWYFFFQYVFFSSSVFFKLLDFEFE